jgi:hypothetical protein
MKTRFIVTNANVAPMAPSKHDFPSKTDPQKDPWFSEQRYAQVFATFLARKWQGESFIVFRSVGVATSEDLPVSWTPTEDA